MSVRKWLKWRRELRQLAGELQALRQQLPSDWDPDINVIRGHLSDAERSLGRSMGDALDRVIGQAVVAEETKE